ncbi:unnamed protein product [Amaranthus hypochondriacus]
MISTRTLHVPWDSAGCLCPVGDFFNYAAPGDELTATGISSNVLDDTEDPFIGTENSDCSGRLIDGGYEEDLAAYCFYSKKNYGLGEQVLLSYGTYTNLELLEHYGFLLNRNPNDKVIIPLEHDIFTCHSWPADSLYIQHDGKPSFALLSALRLWKTPPNQRKLVGYVALSGLQLSPENETIVMKWLLSNCQTILRNLPSTIEDDQSLLGAIDKAQQIQSFEKPKTLPSAAAMEFCKFLECMETCYGASEIVLAPSSKVKRSMERWKMAVQWRLRYKQTLLDCISYCSHTIASLSPEHGTNCRAIQDQTPP